MRNTDDARNMIKDGKVTERSLKEILALYDISVPRGIVVKSLPDRVDLKFPVVLKVSDPNILHKTDVGGVKVGISSYEELMNAFEEMSHKFSGKEFLIEEMVDTGVEVIIGILKDASFGQVIMLGMGGIYTELYHDVAFRLLPIDRYDAGEMIESVGIRRFVNGFRGRTISKPDLENLLLNISKMVEEIGPEIRQLDLNPVILSGSSAVVADAKLISDESD